MMKPILLGVEGEAQQVVKRYNAGLYFDPENKADFLDKLNSIYKNKEQYTHFQKGCLDLAKAFDRRTLALKMYKVIELMVPDKAGEKQVKLNVGLKVERGGE